MKIVIGLFQGQDLYFGKLSTCPERPALVAEATSVAYAP